jgi:hypothetical protein
MKKNNNKKNNNKAVVPFEGNLPSNLTQEEVENMLAEDMQATMEGVIPQLPQVDILHAGALMFELPPNETGKRNRVEEFEGIIIDQHPCNVYWEVPFGQGESNSPPDCFSLDGIHGTTKDGEEKSCIGCPYNERGSAPPDPITHEKSNAKACKNKRRIHILVEGNELPWRLTLSPMNNIRASNNFFSPMINKKKPMNTFVTRFSLEEATSRKGIPFSGIVMERVKPISGELWLKIRDFLKDHKAQIRGQAFSEAEYQDEKNNGEKEEELLEGDLEDLVS